MDRKSFKKSARSGTIVRIDFEPGINKGTNQPRPHRALMVCAIAGAQIASVNRFVIRTIRRKRAQADWCDQFLFYDLHYGFPMCCIEDRMIERDGEQLIW